MRSRLSLNTLIASVALVAALVLTLARPSPEGIISFGERVVRAAPGAPSSSVIRHNLTALKIFNLTLVRIRDAYVDPQRIDPKAMLYSALDSVQFDIPEVLIEPDKDANQVVVVVNDKRQRFSTADVDSPWRLAGKLKKIFRFIEANMNPGADLAEVEYAAVNGMLKTLDPHSVLLDPESAREMEVSTNGKFGGVGIVIRMFKPRHKSKAELTVVRPIKGTPAHIAGIHKGDHIARINQEVTENLTLTEAVNRMRGDPGTPLVLWIERKGEKDLIRFDITRESIKVESVDEVRLLSKNIGYIRLNQFSGHSTSEVRDAMSKLRGQGARGWILDLRRNPGGLLEQAIKVSDLFVDKGTIVTTVGNHERDPRRAKRKSSDTKLPVAVLVGSNSASASEIVAGALKNLNRALIIGNTTFGKGSVQVLYDNDDGSKLKLTIAQYLTPGDRSIQSVGITPDIELQRMLVPKKYTGPKSYLRLLKPSHRYRESDLHAHLTSRYAKGSDKPSHTLSFLYEPPRRKAAAKEASAKPGLDPARIADPSIDDGEEAADPLDDEDTLDDFFTEDFEIKLARDIVAASTKPDRKSMLATTRRILDRTRREQDNKLAVALAALGVDWSAAVDDGASQAVLSANISLDSPGPVKAGDTVKLNGTVTNVGTGTAYRVHARIKSEDRVFSDTELLFGRVEPGQSRSWTSFVKVPKDALDRIDVLRFELSEASGAKLSAAPIKFRITAAERPVFAYTHQLIDDGNGDGLVQRGERHRIRVTIENKGVGTAKDTTALLRNASGDEVVIKKGRFPLGELKPGSSKTVEFVVEVKDLSEKELVVEMTVYDAVLHEAVNDKLEYPIASASAGPAAKRGTVEVKSRRADIYEGASAKSGRIASASKGTVFRITGRQGKWLRVALEDKRPGFVASVDVRKSNASAPRIARIDPHWQVTPPDVKLQIPSFETSATSYKLRGVASDETHVEDVYIFVSNRDAKVDNRKIFYRSNRNGKLTDRLDFEAKIPLWPGSNRITVVARENDDVRSSRTIYMYSSGSPGKERLTTSR